MALSSPIRADINKTLCTWQWYVDGTSAAGTPPGTPRFAKDVCKNSMKGWEINRSGNTDEERQPHIFYTVLGKPTAPCYRSAAPSDGLTTEYPWVSALEFAIITNVRLAGIVDSAVAATKIANFCYAAYGLKYNHREADSLWVTGAGAMGMHKRYDFQYTNFLTHPGSIVNCQDLGCSVATLIDLTTGLPADVVWMPEFGYVNTSKFAGGEETNNPLFRDGGFVPDKIVPTDDTGWRTDASGKIRRSCFDFHVWCRVASSGVNYDACSGDGASATQESDTEFRVLTCDVSNCGAGINWPDNEKVARYREADGTVIPPEVPWLEAGYADTEYAFTTDAIGETAEHANFSRVRVRALNLD